MLALEESVSAIIHAIVYGVLACVGLGVVVIVLSGLRGSSRDADRSDDVSEST